MLPRYKRILLKLSGESLMGDHNFGLDSGVLAQYDQSVLDRIDGDETLEFTREIRGAPRKIFRDDKAVTQLRADREQQAANQANLMATESLANAAGKATPAVKAMQDANAGRVAA